MLLLSQGYGECLCEWPHLYFMRFGINYEAPLVPFGAQKTHTPISKKDFARVRSMGAQVLSELFVGYSQRAGG